MTTTTIDLKDAEKHFDKLSVDMQKAALRGLLSAAQRAQQEIMLRIIPSRSPKPVDRAASGYLGGWRVRPAPDGAWLENLETHAAFIEYGVRAIKPGQMMIRMLAAWVVRKGLASVEESTSVAWAIVTIMKSRGGIFNRGKGFGILKEAREKHIPRFIKEEVAREVDRL